MQPTLSDSLLDYAGQSSPGRRRNHNEDALLCAPQLGLWAIADGMGGHQCGEIASSLALSALHKAIEDGEPLQVAVQQANQAVVEEAVDDGMGTTLVAAQFNGADFELTWVGDSRAYLVSANGIEQLTRDHSWVQMMIDAGELKPAEAEGHAWRNIILRCLGREAPLELGTGSGTLSCVRAWARSFMRRWSWMWSWTPCARASSASPAWICTASPCNRRVSGLSIATCSAMKPAAYPVIS